MIIEEIKYLCPDCGNDQLKRNGCTGRGKQKYKCKACVRYGSLNRLTITSWIKKAQSLPSLSEKLLPTQSGDVLELDEIRSFVQKKACKSCCRLAWPRWVCHRSPARQMLFRA